MCIENVHKIYGNLLWHQIKLGQDAWDGISTVKHNEAPCYPLKAEYFEKSKRASKRDHKLTKSELLSSVRGILVNREWGSSWDSS